MPTFVPKSVPKRCSSELLSWPYQTPCAAPLKQCISPHSACQPLSISASGTQFRYWSRSLGPGRTGGLCHVGPTPLSTRGRHVLRCTRRKCAPRRIFSRRGPHTRLFRVLSHTTHAWTRGRAGPPLQTSASHRIRLPYIPVCLVPDTSASYSPVSLTRDASPRGSGHTLLHVAAIRCYMWSGGPHFKASVIAGLRTPRCESRR